MFNTIFSAAVLGYLLGTCVISTNTAPGNPMPIANPTANSGAIIFCDSVTRLTVLTKMIVRAEQIPPGTFFQDKASISFINRMLNVPEFTVRNTSEWCNVSIQDGVTISILKNVPTTSHQWSSSTCNSSATNTDAVCQGKCNRVGAPLVNMTKDSCCKACDSNSSCGNWVLDTSLKVCYLLMKGSAVNTKHASNRVFGGATPAPSPPAPPNSGLYAPGVLTVSSKTGDWSWNAWESDTSNLLGTLHSTPSADLAGCCKNPNATAGKYDPKPAYVLQPGLLSRSGAAIVDDSTTPLLDIPNGDIDDAWLSGSLRVPGSQDLYVFGCGTAYRSCMADFVKVSGPMAFPPISALGVWWSRHWGNPHNIPWGKDYFGPMTEDHIMTEVVQGYETRNLPLHIVVMDMEWHEMFQEPCYINGKGFWGGYTWNKTLFPDPAAFVSKLHSSRGPLGIRVAVNTHPDEGIDACQQNYKEMGAAIGEATDKNQTLTDLNQACGTEAAHPEITCTRKYVEAYFKYMIDPMGCDYSWTDSPQVTTFSNELYVRYPGTLKKKRSINFSRYGGLGQHRTPIGFSGDTIRQWDTLTYQTYFTPRAANVAFGWWSHDIGGFSGAPVDNVFHTEGPELYLRWLQWGAFSPILRTHCRYCEQRIWTWGNDWYQKMRLPLITRSNFVPYINTHTSLWSYPYGEALLTPTYWDESAAQYDAAYAPEFGRQYFFGRDMLVAPVTEAVNNQTNASLRTIWLPEGSWVEWNKATVASGPSIVTQHYSLNEIPIYLRAGAVIPTRTMASAYNTTANPLVWIIAHGSSGAGSVFEDDGDSLDFKRGIGAVTHLNFSGTDSNKAITITPSNGTFDGMAQSRSHWTVFHGVSSLPTRAHCNGMQLSPTKPGQSPGFWTVGPTVEQQPDSEIVVPVISVVIACPSSVVTSAMDIQVLW